MEYSTRAVHRDHRFDFRVLAALLLLVPAVFFTWRTWNDLEARRELRTELAEISHARYQLFNASQWVAQILPIINKQIDAIDLTAGNQASLRPMAERALNRLLDQVKEQMAPKPGAGGGFAAQAMSAMVNSMIDSLRPKVPEFADTVLKELGSKDNKEAIKRYIEGVIADGAKNTFSPVDMTWYSQILKRNGCADAAACHDVLGKRIDEANRRISGEYMTALGSAALALILLLWQRERLSRTGVTLAMLFCLTLLAGGVLSPMLEVEARISRIDMTFFGQPLSFGEQVLYYQSKTVLEVFHTLIDIGQPEMYVVAVLLLTFSVIFPALKLLTLGVCLIRPEWLTRSRIAKFFALESSKWSMADVMAIAIFMSFVAFNGVISGALGGLKSPGSQIVIPTDSSRVLAGFYLFVGFVLSSLFLSRKLEKDLRTASRSDTGPAESRIAAETRD
jgi:hypothetical protein